MLDCNKIKEIMSLYIDNELDNNEKIEFENHIQNCDSCKKEFEELKNIIIDINNLPQEELPENFHNDLMLLLKHESKKKEKINWWQYSTVAACFATLILAFNVSKVENNATENLQAQYEQSAPMLRSAPIDSGENYNPSATPYELNNDIDDSENNAVPEKAKGLYSLDTSSKSHETLEIIKFNITIETNEFDNILNIIYNTIPQVDSEDTIENDSLRNMYIYSKTDINNFDNIVESLKQINGVINSTITYENKTDEYMEIKSKIESEASNEVTQQLNKNLSDIEYLANYPQIIINLIEK